MISSLSPRPGAAEGVAPLAKTGRSKRIAPSAGGSGVLDAGSARQAHAPQFATHPPIAAILHVTWATGFWMSLREAALSLETRGGLLQAVLSQLEPAALTMSDYRAVTTLVPRIALGTMAILVAGTIVTNNNNNTTTNANKPIYLCILVVAFALTVIFLRNHRSARFDSAVALLASAGLIWGIWTIERPQMLQGGYWEGFGDHVAIAAVILLLLFGTVLQPHRFTTPIRVGLALIVVICCVFDVLGGIRTFDFMTSVNNNQNEINDMLGPVAGRIPDATYIPQYTNLYGWLFWPLKPLLTTVALVGAMSIFLTLMGFATVLLAVRIVKRALGRGAYVVALALVVPLTYVTSHQLGVTTSIASLFQELPIRLFSGFLIITIGLNDLVLLYRGTVRAGHLLLIGFVCGAITWNSQDFGFAATAVYGLIIMFGAMPRARNRAIGAWLAGLFLGVASYPIFLLCIGSPLNLSFVGTFIKLFGSGLGTAPMQVPGPVLVVMPTIVCSAGVGWALMKIRHREGMPQDPLLDRATLTLTFAGTWSVLGLLYYVNRAYADAQLQTMLLPSAVCIGALLSIAIHSSEVRALWQEKLDLKKAQLSAKVRLIPVGILVCLCFAAAWLTPNPVLAAQSLLNPPSTSGFANYDFPPIIQAIRAAQEYTAGKPGELTYLGENFNYVSLVTHVQSNTVLFPQPPDGLVKAVIQIDCQYLGDHHSRWMVLSSSGLAAFGPGACGMYEPVAVSGLAYGQLQALR